MGESLATSKPKHTTTAGRADVGEPMKCTIFRAQYRPSAGTDATSREAMFAARRTMAAAHAVTMEMLRITKPR